MPKRTVPNDTYIEQNQKSEKYPNLYLLKTAFFSDPEPSQMTLYHRDNVVNRIDIIEEYFFDEESKSELKNIQMSFKNLEQSDAFNHPGVQFDSVVEDTHFKSIINIDMSKINFNDINTDLFNFIGGIALNDNQQISYEKYTNILLENGFNHKD